MKKVIIAFIVILFVVAGTYVGARLYKRHKKNSNPVNVYSLEEYGDSSWYEDDSSSMSGTISSTGNQKIYLDSSKQLKEIYVKVGDKVKAGQEILKYDDTQARLNIESMYNELEVTKAELTQAYNELEKLKKKKPTEKTTQKKTEATTQKKTTEATTEEPTPEEPTTEEPTTEAPTAAPAGQSGVDLANYACQFIGYPYVYGGTSLTGGADCSGFVLAIYAQWGISLPHDAELQANYGTEVSLSELQPGDLLFYPSMGYAIGHVGIYIGDGMIVHASNERDGIKTSVYNYKTPVKATRLLGQ